MFVFPFIFAITFKEADASPEAILKQASQEKFENSPFHVETSSKNRLDINLDSDHPSKKMAYLQRGFVKDWANSV